MNPPSPWQADRQEGERRKDAALALLEGHRDILIRRGRRALLSALLVVETADADDVADAIGPTPDIDRRALGAIPGPLARAGIIRRAGYGLSTRPGRHASILTRWTLANRGKALVWLSRHPDLPDDGADDAAGAPSPVSLTPSSPTPPAIPQYLPLS